MALDEREFHPNLLGIQFGGGQCECAEHCLLEKPRTTIILWERCDEGVIRHGESTETGLAEIHLVRVSVLKIAENNEMKTCSSELLAMSSE